MDNSFLSDLIITKVYSVSSFYNERGAGSERVNRPSCAVVLKYTGETVYCCHGKNYVSDFCNMALLPKGCSYRWTCSQTGYVYIAEFDCNITADNIYTFPVSCGDKALQLFRQSESCLTKGAPSSKLETVKNLYSLILMLTDSGQQKYITSDKRTYLAPAIDYIAKNFTRRIRNDDMAKAAGISTVYFRKLFTAAYGISPAAYLQNLRINKAKDMLKSDYGSITDIALSLGYSDIYDFSRVFKRLTGISPAAYAKQLCRNGEEP